MDPAPEDMIKKTVMNSRSDDPPLANRKVLVDPPILPLSDFFFDFTQLKPTDTWPRDRCGRAQLVLLPSLADSLRLGADL